MGKQGPCYHCGVTSTPLWRNGPPEKPILCNACGSRWRTKGTLSHYTPLHARAEPDEFEDYRVSRLKSISIKNKEAKVLKRKHNHDSAVVGGITPDYSRGSLKGLDDDTSNRSSSGSVISNSESCVQFSSPDASDLTGQAQSLVWDKMVPSRKRTCVSRPKTSSMEKLTKDLCTILHEQQSQFSGTSEEELIYEIDTPMTSVEIGHGSVLIRHPSSIGREEESEASSLSVDKPYSLNEGYSRLTALPVHKGAKFPSTGKIESKKPSGQGTQLEHIKRDKAKQEKIQILGHDNSPLRYVDLKYVLNFDQFASHLTNEEQHQLLKYLPPVDTTRLPDSLKSMFASLQFEENLSSFQNLLAEGVFDLSLSGVKDEDCRMLNKLVLCNLKKSEWVEQYTILKDENSKSGNRESVTPGGPNGAAFGNSTNVTRSCDGHFQNFPGAKTALKSPKRVVKGSYKHKEVTDDDGYCFSPRSLFALPPDISPLMIDSFQFMGESSDQDLLLDVPSNGSFPQAELLVPTSSFGAQASTSSSSIYS